MAEKEKLSNDILEYIKKNPNTSTDQISKELKLDHTQVVGICKSLEIKETFQMFLENALLIRSSIKE